MNEPEYTLTEVAEIVSSIVGEAPCISYEVHEEWCESHCTNEPGYETECWKYAILNKWRDKNG